MITAFCAVTILLSLMLLRVIATTDAGVVPQSQVDALHYLYAANNGDDWKWDNTGDGIPWNFTANFSFPNPCTDNWQGVLCSPVNCSQTPNCTVTSLKLVDHGLTGTLPPELSQLPDLQFVNLYKNKLHGSLPSSLGQLSELTKFVLYRNCISGTIPTELGLLQKMRYLDLGNNRLTGGMPFLPLPLVEVLYIDRNNLISTIPAEFGTYSRLTLLAICINQLTGTIPTQFGALTQLSILNLHRNLLTGTVPSQMNDLTGLRIYNLAYNFLTGRVDSLVLSDSIYYFYMTSNLFTGPFPFTELCQSHSLLNLLFANNLLTGSISTCIGNWAQANTMDISWNKFTGTLPTVISSLTKLGTLITAGNYFTDSLGGVLGNAIGTLNLSDNGFDGSLPYAVFNSTALRSFVAVKNCFSGSLTSDLCRAVGLHTLDLSGLTAGEGCIKRADAALHVDVYVVQPVQGSLPSCLFQMSSLVQLAASGNALEGALYDLPAASALVNISLSNNRLQGTIPKSFQQRWQLQTLDLSYNHLSGTIEHMTNYSLNYASDSTAQTSTPLYLHLSSNRLSGSIPKTLAKTTTSMSILNGNMFSCPNDRFDLPESDTFRDKYVCASDELDFLSYCFLGSAIAAIGVVVLVGYYTAISLQGRSRSRPVSEARLQAGSGTALAKSNSITQADDVDTVTAVHSSHDGRLPDSQDTEQHNSIQKDTSVKCSDLIGLGVVKSAILPENYSALQQAWTLLRWGSGDTSGHAVVDALSVSLSKFRNCCIAVTVLILTVALPAYIGLKSSSTADWSTHTYQYGWLPTAAYLQYDAPAIVMFFLWLMVVGFVIVYEALYVVHVTGDKLRRQKNVREMDKTRQLRFFSFVVGNVILVLVVNGIYVYSTLSQPQVIHAVISVLMVVFKLLWNTSVVIPTMEKLGIKFITVMGVMTFNNNVAPILATMAVNINCFSSLFSGVAEITNTYSVSLCSLIFTATNSTGGSSNIASCYLFDEVTNSINFSPPFVYSNQCSSSLLASYAPLYLTTYGVVGVLVPAMQLALLVYFGDMGGPLPPRPSRKSTSATATTSSCVSLPNKLSLLRAFKKRIHHYSKISNRALCAMVLPLNDPKDLVMTGRNTMYHSRQLALNWNSAFLILLTYGLACPILGVAVLLHLTLSSLSLQFCVSRHQQQADGMGSTFLQKWTALLVHESCDVHKIIFSSRTFILLFSCLFAVLFIFDMTYNHDHALLATLSVLLVMLVYCSIAAGKCYRVTSTGAEKELGSAGEASEDQYPAGTGEVVGAVVVSDMGAEIELGVMPSGNGKTQEDDDDEDDDEEDERGGKKQMLIELVLNPLVLVAGAVLASDA